MMASSPACPSRFCARMLSANSHGWPERKMDSAVEVTRRRRRGALVEGDECKLHDMMQRVVSAVTRSFAETIRRLLVHGSRPAFLRFRLVNEEDEHARQDSLRDAGDEPFHRQSARQWSHPVA